MKKSVARFLQKTTAIAVLASCLGISANSSAEEFRGLWVDAFGSGFLTPTEVTSLVNDCKTYNFNAVMVQMRRRGDAFYIPQAPNGDPRTTAIAANYDALQELINKCHASEPRIEVHCWVAANLIWGDTTKAPTQAGHVFNLHPEYLNKTSGGSTEFGEGYFLDPGNPDAMSWNYNMAKDIVSRYDIDGFHWDYIRYPQQDSGYNATAIARYNAEFGLTGQPTTSSSQFSTWRRRQITDFLRWVNSDLMEIKPSLVISAAVFANRSDATSFRFQNWAGWNNEGILDITFPMNYTSDNTTYITRLDDAFNNQGVRAIYMGLGAYLNNASNTVFQLNTARSKPFGGTAVFSYRTSNSGTVNQDATFQYIKDNYQPTWTPTPTLPWIANPTKGLIKGTVTRADNNAAIYNAVVSLGGAATRTQKTEPHGKFALFEVAPGTYTVSATSGGVGSGPVSVTVTAGGIYNVNLSIDLPAIPDTTFPVISAVRASNITSNSCVITWTTDEASDSTVDYGTTAAYDESTNTSALVTSHSVTVTGLQPGTTYQYQVKSADAAGNETVSANAQLTTIPAQADLIVDNLNATVVGVWSTNSTAADRFGSDYRFRGRGAGASFLRFTPNITAPGNYQVFEWHSAGSNRATNVPFVVTSLAGTQTYFVNQQVNGGKWNYVGTFYFQAGTAGNVRITDGFADAASGRVVIADAVRFIYLPEQDIDDIVIDNPSAALTGSWSTQTSSTDKFGADYRFKSRGTGTSFLTYTPNIPVAGDYQVFEWHPRGSNRPTNAPHVVTHSLGSQTVFKNQQINGGKWNLLGTFGFNQGSSGNVRITDGFTGPTNGVVMADAIRLVYVPPPAPPAPPASLLAEAVNTTQIDLEWSASASGINFVIGRSETAGGPYTDIATIAANITSYNDTGLTPNTTYYYVVRAVGAGGPSNNSTEASATTLPIAPEAPSNLAATAVSHSQIDLAWSDGDSLDIVFVVSRSTDINGVFTDIASTEARLTSYSDTGLDANTTYYYRVRARNAGGDSANSNTAGATTLSAAPAAASGLVATVVSATQIDLSWTDNASNEESVTVQRSSANGGYTVVATLPANTTSFSDTTVSGHTSYFYFLQVANGSGSAISEAVQATTPNSAPVANAGMNQSAFANESCQATVVLDGSGSSDPEQDALSYVWSGPFGTVAGQAIAATLPLGTHSITLTVNDGNGGTDSALVTVTVTDNTAPVLSLTGGNALTLECHDLFVDPGATATDACAGDLSGSITVSGTVDANTTGSYTLTYTVIDPSGNTTTLERTVTVVDTTAPALAVNGIDPMVVECHSQFNDPGATATDLCAGDLTTAIIVTGSVDANTPGSYTLTYTVGDASGNVSVVTRTVNVVDTTAPTLTVNGSGSSTVECHGEFSDTGATASDLCSGDLTSAITVTGSVDVNTPGVYTITYSVADPSGNVSTATRTVTVVDRTPPTLTIEGAASMTLTSHQPFNDPGAQATDVCGGDLTSAIQVEGTVNPDVLGTYTVKYSVADASGNTATAIRTVNVVDTSAPTVTLNGAASITLECHAGFSDPGASASDDYAGDLSATIVVTGTVDANTPGDYTLTYTATDPSGNSASAVRTIKVVDTTAPVLTLSGDASVTIEAHTAFVDAGATASDVCAGDLTSVINVSGSVNNAVPGVYTLTYSVADASGNTTTADRTVTVVDTTAPVISSLTSDLTTLWSPDHTMRPVTLSAVVADAVDAAPVTKIISVTSNETANNGAGDTAIDWEVTGDLTLNLRAERSGKTGDRIYTITVESADASGNKSTKTVNVVVTHDQRASN